MIILHLAAGGLQFLLGDGAVVRRAAQLLRGVAHDDEGENAGDDEQSAHEIEGSVGTGNAHKGGQQQHKGGRAEILAHSGPAQRQTLLRGEPVGHQRIGAGMAVAHAEEVGQCGDNGKTGQRADHAVHHVGNTAQNRGDQHNGPVAPLADQPAGQRRTDQAQPTGRGGQAQDRRLIHTVGIGEIGDDGIQAVGAHTGVEVEHQTGDKDHQPAFCAKIAFRTVCCLHKEVLSFFFLFVFFTAPRSAFLCKQHNTPGSVRKIHFHTYRYAPSVIPSFF